MSRIQNLITVRRIKRKEMLAERDPIMRKVLIEHIAQLDDDIAGLDDETTVVTTPVTMQELINE